jgi:hypothetical protein
MPPERRGRNPSVAVVTQTPDQRSFTPSLLSTLAGFKFHFVEAKGGVKPALYFETEM